MIDIEEWRRRVILFSVQHHTERICDADRDEIGKKGSQRHAWCFPLICPFVSCPLSLLRIMTFLYHGGNAALIVWLPSVCFDATLTALER